MRFFSDMKFCGFTKFEPIRKVDTRSSEIGKCYPIDAPDERKADLGVPFGMASSGLQIFSSLRRRLEYRSRIVPLLLKRHIVQIALAWVALFGFAALLRIVTVVTPVHGIFDFLTVIAPYALVLIAPIAGYLVAAGAFPNGNAMAQPEIRLSRFGRWQSVSITDARAHPAFGPAGFMASLLVGLGLNVVVRTGEFLMAVPAMSLHAPGWGLTFLYTMTLDLAVMSFFYMVCFVAALRNVPYFPRLLLFVWLLDIVAQLMIAKQIAPMPGLPSDVAALLNTLLYGNMQKVLISMFVWLPYLILSERVNVTYRQRVELPKAPAASSFLATA